MEYQEFDSVQLNRELDSAITFIQVVKDKDIDWVCDRGIDHLRAAIATLEDTIGSLEEM